MSARDIVRTVGRYEILDELGRGGMATVYLARQTDLDRSVALKELSAFRQSDPAFAHRFLRESRLAGSLTHPNIVTVHDYFENDGIPYIAMEYVPGGSLRPHIGHMALTQIAGVLEGILSALDYAEQHDIVHRDLKPENVMLTSAGRVKIADFGIAKATGKAQTGSFFTATGTTVGTPNYMAPEQAMGQEVGPGTDLYSVGIMAFEFFVGQVPFHDTEEPMAVLMRQVSDPIPPASSLNPEVDDAVSDWIEGLLEKDPAERTRSAGHAWEELEEIVISMAGPRWRRTAPLVAPSRRPVDAPAGPLTPPPIDAPRPPLMPTHDVPDWPPTGQRTGGRRRTTGSEARTRRLREGESEALAATVMPEAPTRRLGHGDAQTLEAPGGGRRRGVVRVAKVALALFAVLAALAAAFGGRDSQNGGDTAAVPTAPVSSADLTIGVPRGWSRLRSSPDLGLQLSRPVAVAQDGRGGGPVVEFGMARGATAANSTLLPQSLLTAIGNSGGAPPARTAVRLPTQGLEAWRYRRLRPVGTPGALTVYAVPTSGGVATLACAAPPGQAGAFAAQCESIAGTLQLRRGTPYPIGPSGSYASALNGAIGELQQTTRSQEANLETASTLDAQATAGLALARAYETAAVQLAGLDLSPADRNANAHLVAALTDAGSAYRAAARAAGAGNAARYRAASAAIPVVKAQVNDALAGVRAAGYEPAAGAPPAAGNAPPASGDPAAGGSQPDQPAQPKSGVGDSKSDDASDDEEDPDDS